MPLKNLNHSDILSTFLEFTVISIQKGIEILPSLPNKFIIMGGGQHNKYLMEKLKLSLPTEIIEANQIGIDGDYVEADMIAYLAMRRLANMPITYPNTTGVNALFKVLVVRFLIFKLKNLVYFCNICLIGIVDGNRYLRSTNGNDGSNLKTSA